MTAPTKSALDLAHEAIADARHWSPSPWIPAFDDDGDFFTRWDAGEDGHAVEFGSDYDHELADLIAAMRAREPLLAAAVVELTERLECHEAARVDVAGQLAAVIEQRDLTYDMFRRNLGRVQSERDSLRAELVELRNASGVTAWASDVRLAAKLAKERDALRAELAELRKRIPTSAHERK